MNLLIQRPILLILLLSHFELTIDSSQANDTQTTASPATCTVPSATTMVQKSISTLFTTAKQSSEVEELNCNLKALPIDESSAANKQLHHFIGEIQKKLEASKTKKRTLSKIEYYMLSRAYYLALENKDLCATPSLSGPLQCSLSPPDKPLPWKNDFWKIIGINGCEGVDDFKTRLAIDMKMGQIQIATREPNQEYLRIAIDLCRCSTSVENGLPYEHSDPAINHADGFNYLKKAEQTQPKQDRQLTSALVDQIHANQQIVVATLGFARGSIANSKTYIDKVESSLAIVDDLLKARTKIAFRSKQQIIGGILTGGYKGVEDQAFGITRAGHEVAKRSAHHKHYRSLVITPEAGIADTHETPDSRSVVGHLWGDDSKALVGATDLALVFYRGSTHHEKKDQFGRWTEIEVAHLKAQGVPYLMIDIDQSFNSIRQQVMDELRTSNFNYVYNSQKIIPNTQKAPHSHSLMIIDSTKKIWAPRESKKN